MLEILLNAHVLYLPMGKNYSSTGQEEENNKNLS
jgi:hypothetical protein